MVLCVDLGNTDIDVGVYENDTLKKVFKIEYQKGLVSRGYIPGIKAAFEQNNIQISSVEGCVLCSVVPGTTAGLYSALKEVLGFEPMLFSNDDIAAIGVKIGNPQEVGADIVASCLAVKKSGKLPAVVIDMGTATTVTAMDGDGDILGVSIIPGVLLALKALGDKTGLPIDTSLTAPPRAIGTDTPQSMASGSVLGAAYCIDGMVSAFSREMGAHPYVIATGGISNAIIPLCKTEIDIDPELLLSGLYMYYKAAKDKRA